MRSQHARKCPRGSLRTQPRPLAILFALWGPLLLPTGAGAQAPRRAGPPPPASAPAAVPAPLEVAVGGRITVKLPGLTRLRILDPALADARVEAGGVVRLQGLARGQTELVVWRDGREERRVLVVR